MASSYTGLGTELMTTGENAGTWGTTTNTNLQIIEQISGGYVEQSVTSTPTTLSVSDGSTGATLGHRVIKFTGTISEATTVTVPLDVQQMYILVNGTSGNYTLTFKYVTGSGSTAVWQGTDKGTKLVYAAADHATNPNMVDSGIGSTAGHDLDGNEFILDADADTSITADTDDQIDIKIAGADDFQFTANTFTAQAGSTIAAQALTATTVTASGIVKTDDTTEATSTTDGSLQTDGGLSVAKDAVIGDDLKLLSDSAVLSFGADSDTTLTHTDGTGLTLNSANKLLFRDSALSISSSTDGQLDIDADTEVEIATTTLDLNGALDVSGASQFSSTITVGVDDAGHDVKFFGDTASAYMLWDTSTDDLVLAGAAGIDLAGDIDVDGTANLDAVDIDGAVQIDNTITVGANDQGYDIIFYGDTASANMTWDTSVDDLILNGAARIVIPDSQLVLGSTAVTATAAEINLIDGGASTGTTAVADADGILTNDGGTMRLTTAATFKTYFQSGVTASSIAADDIAAGDGAVTLSTTSGNITVDATANNSDIIFKGTDATSDITMLTLDGSDAGTAIFNNDVSLDSDSAVLKFGDDQDVTLTHTDGTGLTLNSTSKLTFGDAATYINQSSDGVMTVAGEATIDLTASTAVLVSNDLKLDSDSAVLGFGADNDTTLTHTDGTGLTLNSTNKLCFYDSAISVSSSTDGQMDIDADTEVEIATGTLDIDASSGVDISTDLTIGDDLLFGSSGAVINFNSGDVTLTHSSNALTLDGGVLDLDGEELVLDPDGDTSITADTDDQIDIRIAGADDFQFTANTFTIAAGSTIVNSGTMSPDISSTGKAMVLGF